MPAAARLRSPVIVFGPHYEGKKTYLLFVLFGSFLAADEVPFRSAVSLRGLNEALVVIAEKLTPAVVMVATKAISSSRITRQPHTGSG
jgi:hypothetical protein